MNSFKFIRSDQTVAEWLASDNPTIVVESDEEFTEGLLKQIQVALVPKRPPVNSLDVCKSDRITIEVTMEEMIIPALLDINPSFPLDEDAWEEIEGVLYSMTENKEDFTFDCFPDVALCSVWLKVFGGLLPSNIRMLAGGIQHLLENNFLGTFNLH